MNWREAVRRATGSPVAQCYVMAEAYWHLEGKCLGWRPMQAKAPVRFAKSGITTVSHWWLEKDGRVLDLSKEQFAGPFPYRRGRSSMFLTQAPSKRAAVIMRAARKLMLNAGERRQIVRVSVNGLKIKQNKKDGRRRRIFRREQAGKITYHNKVLIPAQAKLVYSPDKPLKCGARAWIQWEEQ